MELRDYLRVARARWKLILGWVVVATGTAAALTMLMTPVYSSSARLFVSTAQSDSTQAYQASLLGAERITSYADLVSSGQVAQSVIDDLGLEIAPADLTEKVTATVLPETVLLEITAEDPSPQRASQIAQSYAVTLTRLVSELETPPGSDRAPIKATIVDSAAVPETPTSPQPVRNLALGALIGLLIGLGSVVLRELFDVTVKNPDDVAEAAEIPVMGDIPQDPTAQKEPLVSSRAAHRRRVEAFRVLRTNLQFVDVDKDSRVFSVTSCVPVEGKTSTATNLAIVLAQAGQSVLLLEGDLRRPRIHVDQKLERSVGLTTVLVGRVRLREAVQESGVPNLSVLTSGALPPNPAELLQSHAMADVLAEARATYDVVIIDTPPLLPVTDAALLTVQSDGAIVVVRHGRTTKEQLRQGVQRITAVGGRPLGVVLNMTPRDEAASGYYEFDRWQGSSSLAESVSPSALQRAGRPNGSTPDAEAPKVSVAEVTVKTPSKEPEAKTSPQDSAAEPAEAKASAPEAKAPPKEPEPRTPVPEAKAPPKVPDLKAPEPQTPVPQAKKDEPKTPVPEPKKPEPKTPVPQAKKDEPKTPVPEPKKPEPKTPVPQAKQSEARAPVPEPKKPEPKTPVPQAKKDEPKTPVPEPKKPEPKTPVPQAKQSEARAPRPEVKPAPPAPKPKAPRSEEMPRQRQPQNRGPAPAPPHPPLVDTGSVSVVNTRRWDALVRQLDGDPMYHSLAYHRASAHLESHGTIPVLLHHQGRSGETALPLLLRRLAGGHGWDATTVYGYGGPISSRASEDPDFGAAVDEWALENDVIASFLRYHPLLGNHVLGPRRAELTQEGYTASWDVRPRRDLLQSMHPHHRRAARKADRAGLQVRVARAPSDLVAFRSQYEATMKRQDAAPFYYFPDGYWDALTKGCAQNLLLVEGRLAGKVVASILCLVGPPYLHYHLGASDDDGRRIGASNRLFLAAARWAQTNRLSRFHLGGGLGGSPDSTLYTFKQRFDPGSEPQPFYVARWVHNASYYASLTAAPSTAAHFPSWRT